MLQQAYTCLCDIVQQYIESRVVPFLSELPRPIGGYQAVEAQGRVLSTLLHENAEFVQRQENAVFIHNVEEVLVREQDNLDLFEDGEGNDWDRRGT